VIAAAKKASEEKAKNAIEEKAKQASADKAKREAGTQAKNEALARLLAQSIADEKAKGQGKSNVGALYEPATPRDIPLKPAPSKQVSPPPAAKQVSPPPAAKIAPTPSKPAPQNTQSGKTFFIDDAKPQMLPKIQDVKPKGVTGPTIKVSPLLWNNPIVHTN